MQTCSRQTKVRSGQLPHLLLAKAACVLLSGALFLPASAFAQSEQAAVSNISVEPPISHAMSAATSAVVGSGFYQLGAVLTLTRSYTQADEAVSSGTTEPRQAHTPSDASPYSSSTEASGGTAQLSAQDIIALDQAGLLSEIEQRILLNSWHPSEDSGAGKTLSLLLHDIASLKASLPDGSQPVVYGDDNASKVRLLRFKLNGQDVLENTAVLYASPAKEQRAFLLSIDTQQADGSPSETVHLLFKSSGEFLHYKVAACTASQGDEGAIFAKVFAALGDMDAFRTGSIVSLKSTAQGAHLDLLIDLGDEAN